MAFSWTRFLEAPSLPVALLYLILFGAVVPLGPRVRIESPLLNRAVTAYNVACIILSFVSLVAFGIGLVTHGSLYGLVASNPTAADWIRTGFFVYRGTKYLELLDTVWMALKGNRRQISALHVYHHSSMLLLADVSFLLVPYPAVAVDLCLNSLVHVIMYAYYACRSAHVAVPTRMKRFVTELQLAQFFVLTAHAVYGYMYQGFCSHCLLYGSSMILLFGNFYKRAYLDGKPSGATRESSDASTPAATRRTRKDE